MSIALIRLVPVCVPLHAMASSCHFDCGTVCRYARLPMSGIQDAYVFICCAVPLAESATRQSPAASPIQVEFTWRVGTPHRRQTHKLLRLGACDYVALRHATSQCFASVHAVGDLVSRGVADGVIETGSNDQYCVRFKGKVVPFQNNQRMTFTQPTCSFLSSGSFVVLRVSAAARPFVCNTYMSLRC